jgi:hypothetical protein
MVEKNYEDEDVRLDNAVEALQKHGLSPKTYCLHAEE